ncbi:MAG: selenoneine biosynthesis selenosugar synthase SenB [Burkholderiaceae bacterium]|nr:selenoneine biosynthesis selenosugar synthase SenB [Burkholderiaceae bacterium]
MTRRPTVLIASPALAAANNGNWQTASRWSRMLRPDFHTEVIGGWHGQPCDVLIALHARRSADSVAAYVAAHPTRPCIVALTGTDLYRDIRDDASAQDTLRRATHLVVLQDQGLAALPPTCRDKACVIFQSAPPRQPVPPPKRALHVIFVGHLRAEKDPLTLLRAAGRLANRNDIRIDLIGDSLDDSLAEAIRGGQASLPTFRWLGARPHADTRRRIQCAHLLVNSSRMEGGAHVVLEAVQSGTAVLASRIPGNIGMLGSAHQGYFEVGDDASLAALIERARDDAPFLARLRAQGEQRSALFSPAAERHRLHQLITAAMQRTAMHAEAPQDNR